MSKELLYIILGTILLGTLWGVIFITMFDSFMEGK